jgi:response regulator RpfG family c-di-GMP phosphodiesterase
MLFWTVSVRRFGISDAAHLGGLWPSAVQSSAKRRRRPSRLLVVDDDPAVARVVERFARQCGFEVIFKDNGRDALACLAEVGPMPLIDLQMPELSGIDVLRAIDSCSLNARSSS